MRKSFIVTLFAIISIALTQTALSACKAPTGVSPTTLTTSMNTPITSSFTVTGGVNTPPGYSISTSPNKQAKKGTASIAANGDITYTPNAGVSGTDSFVITAVANCNSKTTKTFTITVTINACANNIQMQTVPALSVVAGNTLSWTPSTPLATTTSGNPLNYTATIPANSTTAGSLSGYPNNNGAFNYTSSAGYVGNYSFTITAEDGVSCPATTNVVVNVTAPSACAAPTASNFAFSVPVDGVHNNNLPVSAGTPPYAFSIVTPAARGYLSVYNGTPASGTLSTYYPSIWAAQMGIPVLMSSSPSAGMNNGDYTYTPEPGYTGPDGFDFSVASACGSNPAASAHSSITVGAPVNYCIAPSVGPLNLIVPAGLGSISVFPEVSGGAVPYAYSLATTVPASPPNGSVTINSNTGSITYAPNPGYVGNDHFTLTVASGCGLKPTTSVIANVVVESSNATGSIGAGVGGIVSGGAIIIDNTPNPGTAGIVTNMSTALGGKNFGASNAFNIDGIQVMQRDTTLDPLKHMLVNESGITNTASTSYQNANTNKQLKYFANGQHLFDLDRMRKSANYMRVPASITLPDASTLNSVVGINKVNPTSPLASCTTYTPIVVTPAFSISTPIGLPVGGCHPAGTYGTITWAEFLDNIKNNRTMYGVVRILVPLQIGKAASANNALNVSVGAANIYGFCAAGAGEWCANSPTSKTDVAPGAVVGGNNTPAVPIPTPTAANGYAGQIKVRGTLMFDFVNGTTDSVLGTPGHTIDLAHLPFNPRDIYFKVSVPINVNAANDKNGDGILDNIDYINAVSSHITCGSYPCTTLIPADGTGNSPKILSTQVPQESIDAYNMQYGKNYLSNTDPAFTTKFALLNAPSQYHMLMGSGYAQGWHDAFAELGISAQAWNDLGYVVPADANMATPLTTRNIRDSAFEDIPVYLYTGGLVDMHHHMNVAGLIYVPQAAEIEQKNNDPAFPTKMFMMGGLIVRDGFFLEGKLNAVTLISSDPSSYSSLRVISTAIQGGMLTSALSTMHEAGNGSNAPLGVGLPGGNNVSGNSDGTECVECSGTGAIKVRTRWIQIRPK